ncbi:NAD(P)-binding protein, partial [Aureobasidium melanogenum]
MDHLKLRVSKTLASYYTVDEHKRFEAEGLSKVKNLKSPHGVVVIIENIDKPWANELGSALGIDDSFFIRHANKLDVTTTLWQAIFGNTVGEQRKPSGECTESHSSWHVDGLLRWNKNSPTNEERLAQTNFHDYDRILNKYDNYGWQANTRVSCYKKHGSHDTQPLYLFLIDGPIVRSIAIPGDDRAAMTLYLPLSENRGGLEMPTFAGDRSHSFNESLKRFLSHAWHFDVLFANERCLPPKTFFHLLASSLFEDNLRFIDGQIRDISFNKIRRPSIKINDSLHDLREALVSLEDQVTRTIKWMPPSVRQDLKSIQSKLKVTDRWGKSEAQPYVGFPSETLPDILERCNHLEDFLMQSFQLLISSTSVMNAESEKEQSSRNQSLTRLAFVFRGTEKLFLSTDSDYLRLEELQLRGWKSKNADRYFANQRQSADHANEKLQRRFLTMMVEVGKELNEATAAFKLDPHSHVLDFCMAPGGFVKCVLDLNPDAQVDAFSLPQDQGGHRVLIYHWTKDERISIRWVDVTMFVEEMGHLEDECGRPDWKSSAQKWPYKIERYDLIICDGQVLRTHQGPELKESIEPVRLTCAQLYLGLKRIRPGGTLVVLLHRINTARNFRIIHLFQKFSQVQLFKPATSHKMKSSFYLVAKNIRPDERAYTEAMAHFRQLWDYATYGIDNESQAEFCTEWELSKKSSQPEIDELGATFIELARPVWKWEIFSLYASQDNPTLHQEH